MWCQQNPTKPQHDRLAQKTQQAYIQPSHIQIQDISTQNQDQCNDACRTPFHSCCLLVLCYTRKSTDAPHCQGRKA